VITLFSSVVSVWQITVLFTENTKSCGAYTHVKPFSLRLALGEPLYPSSVPTLVLILFPLLQILTMPPRDRSNQFEIDMYMEDVPGRAGQDAIERSHGNRMRAVPAKHSFNVEISNRELDHPSKQAAEAFQAMVSLQAKLASKLAESLSEEEMKRHRGLRPSLEQISKDDRHETPDILSYTLAKSALVVDKALVNCKIFASLSIAKLPLTLESLIEGNHREEI
jgi:hypothetical protein